MDIPSSVKILGHEYKVVLSNRLFASDSKEGNCDTGQNIITIDSNFAESHIGETFLHEILEAIDSRMELELEHRKICALSETLFQILKENRIRFF